MTAMPLLQPRDRPTSGQLLRAESSHRGRRNGAIAFGAQTISAKQARRPECDRERHAVADDAYGDIPMLRMGLVGPASPGSASPLCLCTQPILHASTRAPLSARPEAEQPIAAGVDGRCVRRQRSVEGLGRSDVTSRRPPMVSLCSAAGRGAQGAAGLGHTPRRELSHRASKGRARHGVDVVEVHDAVARDSVMRGGQHQLRDQATLDSGQGGDDH